MFLVFLSFGDVVSFTGWISSYVVILDLDTKEGATRFPVLFGIFVTIFRFLLSGLSGKISSKLFLLSKLKIAVFVMTIIITAVGFPLLAVYWNSILMGATYSSIYLLIYTLSIE